MFSKRFIWDIFILLWELRFQSNALNEQDSNLIFFLIQKKKSSFRLIS